jgi:hypothetical protein
VPKQLTLQEACRHRRAIDRDERAAAELAHGVQGLCDDFFSSPGLALNDDGCDAIAEVEDQSANALHPIALAEQAGKLELRWHSSDFVGQSR